MKTTFLLLSAVLAVVSGFSLRGTEPQKRVDSNFSFSDSSMSSAGRNDAHPEKYERGNRISPDQADPVPQPPFGWQPGLTPEWFVCFRPASEKARERKRDLLVLCTGSDWCPPCKRLAGEVLQSDEFKEYAARNLVLLYLNFPRFTRQPADQMRHNQEIRRKLGFSRSVPSYILMDPEGQILRRRSGYLPLPVFMEFLRTGKTQQTSRKKSAGPL